MTTTRSSTAPAKRSARASAPDPQSVESADPVVMPRHDRGRPGQHHHVGAEVENPPPTSSHGAFKEKPECRTDVVRVPCLVVTLRVSSHGSWSATVASPAGPRDQPFPGAGAHHVRQ
jgi:hypothetical protein